MKTIIIGMGEVGTAHYKILKNYYDIYCKDKEYLKYPKNIELMIICISYSEVFSEIVKNYEKIIKPQYVNICSTVPVGTCEKLGNKYTHSTTRGIHPNLVSGLLNHTKHIGGKSADIIKRYYEKARIKCITHSHARTTELGHILNNCAYGVNLILADEMQKICRNYNVNYYEAVMLYTDTNNQGWLKMGDPTKVRMILTPPNGNIGGHCLTMSANLIDKEKRTEMINKLANYGKCINIY